MKKLLIISCLMAVTNCYAQSTKLNSKAGFGKIFIGDSTSNLRNINTMPVYGSASPNEQGEYLYYLTNAEDLKLTNDLAFKDCLVKYIKEKAVEISLFFYQNDLIKIYDILKSAYGNPDKEENLSGIYLCTWKTEKNLLQLYSPATGQSYIKFSSVDNIKEHIEKDKKEAMQAASKF